MEIDTVLRWCILAVALMPVACAGLAKARGLGKSRGDGGYDNSDPRDWLSRQQGFAKRANAAQANCFEALPFFIGAALVAQHTQAPAATVQWLAVSFVALRVLYVATYLADLAWTRTAVWIAAMAINIALLFSGA